MDKNLFEYLKKIKPYCAFCGKKLRKNESFYILNLYGDKLCKKCWYLKQRGG